MGNKRKLDLTGFKDPYDLDSSDDEVYDVSHTGTYACSFSFCELFYYMNA